MLEIDWLIAWGVFKTTGLVFKPILEDLATYVAKDAAKDYVKGCFGSVFSPRRKDRLQQALGKALRELLQLIQDELLDNGLTELDLKEWIDDVKKFTHCKDVQLAFRQAFTESDSLIDATLLAQGWQQIPHPRVLPSDFSWQRIANRFARAVRNLREEDSDLREILLTQATIETSRASRQQAGIVPDFDLKIYRQALLERYAKVHFETLDTTGAFYSGVKLWSVFVPQNVRECQGYYYPQLLEIPKEHLQRIQAQSGISAETHQEKMDQEDISSQTTKKMVEKHLRTYLEQAPRPVMEVLGDERIERIVILGDPGSGKSSLLRYLALRWAMGEDSNLLRSLQLLLLIELREYDHWQCSSGKSFVRYLHEAQTWHRLNQLDLAPKLKEQGAVILLLDGIDEIFDLARREQIINDIHRFSNKYPHTRIIVTSRVIGYKSDRLADAKFCHFMLQDLEELQIMNFLDRWHNVTFDDKRDGQSKKNRLIKAFQTSQSIRELAGNPLLLTMMAILNRHQELPRDRAQLYQQAARVLLHEWDTERALESHPQLKGVIGYTEKAEILREVANFMQSVPKGLSGNIIAREDLELILRNYLKNKLNYQQPHAPARDLVGQLRERNFILCYIGADSYAFVHRTFLEYFCASTIVHQFQHEQKLTFEQLLKVYFLHWDDESWHEVLSLIAGMIHERFVIQIIDYLVGQLGGRDSKFHNILLAARCYQEVRNPTTLSISRSKLRNELENLLRLEAYNNPWGLETWQVHRIQARATILLSSPQYTEDSRKWLKDHAMNYDVQYIRQIAVQELARGWRDDPEIATCLKQVIKKDENWSVRYAALQAFARGRQDDSETLSLLKETAERDYSGTVRQAAVQEMARGWKDNPSVLKWLKHHAINDSVSLVRFTALQDLAKGWKDDPETLSILKELAADDDKENVRQAAVQELARGWQNNPSVLSFLDWLEQENYH
jgi:predicted NACHT family NTPase